MGGVLHLIYMQNSTLEFLRINIVKQKNKLITLLSIVAAIGYTGSIYAKAMQSTVTSSQASSSAAASVMSVTPSTEGDYPPTETSGTVFSGDTHFFDRTTYSNSCSSPFCPPISVQFRSSVAHNEMYTETTVPVNTDPNIYKFNVNEINPSYTVSGYVNPVAINKTTYDTIVNHATIPGGCNLTITTYRVNSYNTASGNYTFKYQGQVGNGKFEVTTSGYIVEFAYTNAKNTNPDAPICVPPAKS